MMNVLEAVTAILLSVAAPGKEPVPFAVFLQPSGPSMCHAVAWQMNAQAKAPNDPKFYCEVE